MEPIPKSRAFPNAYLEVDEPPRRDFLLAVAAVTLLVFGAGSVVSDPILLAYIAYYRSAPSLPGIGAVLDNSTPIGAFGGTDAVLALGVGLVFASVLDVVAGLWLWRSLKRGGRLGVALQPVNLFFAYGFGIPALYVLAPMWLLLILINRASLH